MQWGEKMKKIFVALFTGLLLMSGCSSDGYERSTAPGEIIDISLSEMEKMMKNQESFVVSFETTYCVYCAQFEDLFSEYIQDHEVILYRVILDKESTSEQQNLSIIHQYFPEFSTTPGIFYAENGKEKDYLDTYHLGISENVIDEWVIELQLDKKK